MDAFPSHSCKESVPFSHCGSMKCFSGFSLGIQLLSSPARWLLWIPMWFWRCFTSRTDWDFVFFPITVFVSFPMDSLWIVCCDFPHWSWLWSFPRLSWCSYWLNCFGHDRAKNDLGVGFPCPSYEFLVWLHACSGWYSDCVEWDWRLGMLEKPGFGEPHR